MTRTDIRGAPPNHREQKRIMDETLPERLGAG